MAKFCGKCGAELKDGKCPKCGENSKTEAVATTAISTNKMLDLLKGAFKKPVTTAVDESKDSNFGLAWIVLAITSVALGLFYMAYMKATANSLTSAFGEYSSLLSSYSYEPEYFKSFVIMAVAYLAVVNGLIGFMYLFFNKVFKINLSYKKIFTSYQFSGIMTAIALLASAILVFVHIGIGLIVLVVGLLLASVNMMTTYAELVKDKKDSLGYAYALSMGCTYLAIWVISMILA